MTLLLANFVEEVVLKGVRHVAFTRHKAALQVFQLLERSEIRQPWLLNLGYRQRGGCWLRCTKLLCWSKRTTKQATCKYGRVVVGGMIAA